ncbi:MAG: hypothetical protein KBT47_09150 [Armatimonadetes bacterium]|nr:hypothetical protein [Candidatus Hippobium faecium]
MKLKLMLTALLILVAGILFAAGELSEYVNADDGVYSAKLSKIQLSSDQSVSITSIDFSSQIWQNHKFSHNMQIFYPSGALVTDYAFMIIAEGKTSNDWTQTLSYFAKMMSAPVIVVFENPAEKIVDGNESLHNFSFSKMFTDKSYKDTPIAFADVKTIIKAMDAVSEITHAEFDKPIENFVLCGSNECALAVYLAASLGDSRIAGIIPAGLDINANKNLAHQIECYGSIASGLNDFGYEAFKDYAKSPVVGEFINLTDPYNYIKDIKCPKLIMNGTNDFCSVIDSAKFYFDDFVGEKYFWLNVNGGHEFCFTENTMKYSNVNKFSDIILTARAFFYHITKNNVMENVKFVWNKSDNGYVLNIEGNNSEIKGVNTYSVDSEYSDFRNVMWSKHALTAKDGVYSYTEEKPEHGYRCVFAEVSFTAAVGGNYSVFSIPYILE